jgi:chromosome partitioning protein
VERFTRAIRATDYENLDIVPANMSFREFDVFLSRMKNSRSRLKKALKAGGSDYDIIILDCPPNISTLSENVFRAADCIVVPVIPTTLSEHTFEQLMEFFRDNKLQRKKILPFFSMMQRTKKLHCETVERMKKDYSKRFLDTTIPFSAEIEKMGVNRAPVATYAARNKVGEAYDNLHSDVMERL